MRTPDPDEDIVWKLMKLERISMKQMSWAWCCQCTTTPKILGNRSAVGRSTLLDPLKLFLMCCQNPCHLCHLWIFWLLLGVSEPNGADLAFQLWNPFLFQSLPVLFPPHQPTKSNPTCDFSFPLGGGHFSQERPSNHCRCSLNSWGWWRETDIFGKMVKQHSFWPYPNRSTFCIYKFWFGWL